MDGTRDLDLVVYGATGFTGRLVVQHLRERGGDTPRWGIAGRDPTKLARVADEAGVPDVPQVVADSSDPDSLDALARCAATVITTVGPYARYGTPLVQACVEAGTDYVDLTGEVQWVRRMIDRFHARAGETGARIVHCCGFDSIPSDIGVLVAQHAMQERHGTHATTVHTRLTRARGGVSGGTIDSLVNVLAEAAEDPEVREVLRDPHSLLPAGERYGAFTPDRTGAEHDDAVDAWVAPFVMEAVNARVVRRSNALLGYPWGRDFAYDEAVVTGRGAAGRARATALAVAVRAAQASASVDALRGLLERVLPDSGSGPGRSTREAGHFDLRIIAEHPEDRGRDVRVHVHGDRDPGYGATSRMVGEAGLTLAAGEPDVGGGVWTPASALGMALRERLEAHAGVTFSVED